MSEYPRNLSERDALIVNDSEDGALGIELRVNCRRLAVWISLHYASGLTPASSVPLGSTRAIELQRVANDPSIIPII